MASGLAEETISEQVRSRAWALGRAGQSRSSFRILEAVHGFVNRVATVGL